MKYYAVDVRNSCNTTSVTVWQQKKTKMFSRTFGFLHFLFEHFLFTFSGAWKTTKAFFCLSFFVLRFIPFLLSHICKWCRGSFKLNGISQGLLFLNANSLNSLSPSSMSGFFWYILVLRIYQKLFPTRVLAFPKSHYFPCSIWKVLVIKKPY